MSQSRGEDSVSHGQPQEIQDNEKYNENYVVDCKSMGFSPCSSHHSIWVQQYSETRTHGPTSQANYAVHWELSDDWIFQDSGGRVEKPWKEEETWRSVGVGEGIYILGRFQDRN